MAQADALDAPQGLLHLGVALSILPSLGVDGGGQVVLLGLLAGGVLAELGELLLVGVGARGFSFSPSFEGLTLEPGLPAQVLEHRNETGVALTVAHPGGLGRRLGGGRLADPGTAIERMPK